MTRRDHGTLTALAGAGLLLTLFQCWYIYLPPERAALIDICRFTGHIDCFESLSRYGASLQVWRIPVFPALTAVFFFQLALCGFAWTTGGERREGWLAAARLISFPAAGLAIFVLMSDYLVAKKTSASAILVALVLLAVAVLTVLRGLQGARMTAGGRWTALFGVGAVLFGFFLYGAGTSSREVAAVLADRDARKPQMRYASFAPNVPRAGAAVLGNPLAVREVLLFLDLEQEESRAVMREALRLLPDTGGDVVLFLYATGETGAQLVHAQQNGTVRAYLADLAPAGGDLEVARAAVARQEAARNAMGMNELPAAVWHGGRRSGKFRLRDVLAAAR